MVPGLEIAGVVTEIGPNDGANDGALIPSDVHQPKPLSNCCLVIYRRRGEQFGKVQSRNS